MSTKEKPIKVYATSEVEYRVFGILVSEIEDGEMTIINGDKKSFKIKFNPLKEFLTLEGAKQAQLKRLDLDMKELHRQLEIKNQAKKELLELSEENIKWM